MRIRRSVIIPAILALSASGSIAAASVAVAVAQTPATQTVVAASQMYVHG